jgi:hypothetical protein
MSQVKVGYLVLCDGHAKVGGKDCVLGIFNRIFAKEFPTTHAECYLAFELWTSPGKHSLKVHIRDTDERNIVQSLGPLDLKIAESGQASGAIQLRGLPLEKAGIYSFVLELDGEEIGGRDVFVEPMPGPKQRT